MRHMHMPSALANGLFWQRGAFTLSIATGSGFGMSLEDALSPTRGSSRHLPPVPTESTPRSPECRPVPLPHAGKDDPHNECADKFPPNRYPGMDVLVGGKRFDALQVGLRVVTSSRSG